MTLVTRYWSGINDHICRQEGNIVCGVRGIGHVYEALYTQLPPLPTGSFWTLLPAFLLLLMFI